MRDLNTRANSKDALRLIKGKNTPKVLKTYTSDLGRAQQNIDKQKTFIEIIKSSIIVEAASVISVQKGESNIELEMPYIEGYSGEDFAIYGTKDISRNLSLALSGILEEEFKNSSEVSIEKKIFISKLEEVQDLTQELIIKDFYPNLRKILDQASNVITIPVGLCHGDLTLGNLIYSSNARITLIDFLQTYLESPLQDVAKLNQEFKYHWSFRKCPEPLKLKGKIFLASSYPKKLDSILQKYKEQNTIFELLNLIRIAPYLRDDLTCDWLIKSIQKFINEAG